MSIFSQVPSTPISRSTHQLNHSFKMTGDFGGIYPALTELCFAGDSWSIDMEQFIRSMPMIAPVMDMVDVKVDAFFCPIRLVWDDFEDFITLGLTGEASFEWPTIVRSGTSSSAAVNQINTLLFGVGSLSDYLNFPTNRIFNNGAYNEVRDALPFRVYQTIFNEYYLNENLDTPIPVQKSSGSLSIIATSSTNLPGYYRNFLLRYRGWNKDYFTSALPYPQKGPAVRIPYGDLVIGRDPDNPTFKLRSAIDSSVPAWQDEKEGFVNVATGTHNLASEKQYFTQRPVFSVNGTDYELGDAEYSGGLAASLDSSSIPTIEELRYAECLQEFYEAQARGGSRPKEYYLNIWHTRTKDARLDRPEYLGGYRSPVTISDVDQTSQSDISAQATPAGKGISAGGSKVVRYHCSEHGYLMILVSITPRTSYSQGYRRMNLYRDPFDFPNPFFANLGEQEIKNMELYDDISDDKNDTTFGYTPRYAEAKFIPSTVHGQFRSTLNYWTLSRQFASRPNLNSAFVHIDPSELSRIFPNQVTNNDKFVATFYFRVKRRMYLPYWGVPRLIHSV